MQEHVTPPPSMFETDSCDAVSGRGKPVGSSRWLDWLLPLVVFVSAYGMQRSVALLGLDLHHDALMFDAARRTLSGEVPFRDFFYQYNLGTIFLHVLALKALGSQIASLKIVTAIAYALLASLIYACAAVQGARWVGFGWALLWSTLSPFYMPAMNGYHAWSTVYMMAAVMAGAFLLSLAVRNRTVAFSVAGGVCFNLAFWFKQIAGLQILAVLAWLLLAMRQTPNAGAQPANAWIALRGFVVGGLVSAVPFFAYILQHDLLNDWWRSAFVFNGLFAATGHSVSGLRAFLGTVFPIAKDLGYLSLVWAVVPLYAAAIVVVRGPGSGARLLARQDSGSRVLALFALLGLVGWVEFFPLAHAFHTQLFMAPVFALLALRSGKTVDGNGARLINPLLLTSVFVLVAAVAGYEGLRHLKGLLTKITQPMVVLQGDTPVSGLTLAPRYAQSFDKFYEAFLTAKGAHRDLPSLPMSVDPVRALLPDDYPEPATFKMGVDWTWPNEIVEPGFNDRLSQMIAERKAPIYADSVLLIPGYLPVALLEMPSPITATHVLYVPSADAAIREPLSVSLHELYTSPERLQGAEQSGPGDPSPSLVELDELGRIHLDDIVQLHVSIVRHSDFPIHLSDLQYRDYLLINSTGRSGDVASLYRPANSGGYELARPLSQEQALLLAKFLLSRGKLFEYQDRPVFFSTLSSSPSKRPLLVGLAGFDSQPRLLWKKSDLSMTFERLATPSRLFVVVPAGVLRPDETAVLCVQAVMRDRTTANFYVSYQPE